MIDCEQVGRIAQLHQPASMAEIQAAQAAVKHIFPADYVQLLRCSDGLIVPSGLCSLILYATDELEERNATYEVDEYAPGFLAIGDDGRGQAILLDCTTSQASIYLVEHGSMRIEDAALISTTLREWIEGKFAVKYPS